MSRQRLTLRYSGHVQGVGFRYSVKQAALGFEVTGVVRNLPSGQVELVAEGEKAELEEFRTAVRESGLGGLIRQETASWEPATGDFRGFEIVR